MAATVFVLTSKDVEYEERRQQKQSQQGEDSDNVGGDGGLDLQDLHNHWQRGVFSIRVQ